MPTVKTGLKNTPFVFEKIKKLKVLSLITHRKKCRRPKVSKMKDREPVVAFMQKLNESDQLVLRNSDLKR